MTSSSPDHSAATILAYHEGAAGYAEHSRDRAPLARLRDPLIALLSTRPLVLDLGGGPGHDAALLAKSGASVVLLDPAFGLLQEAGAYSALAPCRVNAEARHLPFAGESFDGIWACASLLHVSHDDIAAALSEAHRVLKLGGVAFFSMSEGEPSAGLPVTDLGLATRAYFYHRGDEWALALERAGFDILGHRVNREAGNFNPGSGGWIETYARRP